MTNEERMIKFQELEKEIVKQENAIAVQFLNSQQFKAFREKVQEIQTNFRSNSQGGQILSTINLSMNNFANIIGRGPLV